MNTKIFKKFDKPPPKPFNNEYHTSHYQLRTRVEIPELVSSPEDGGIKSLHIQAIVFMTIRALPLADKNNINGVNN